ncbi:O-antigen ligase family protein [Aquisalibacillus elongatus]|uniref:O-antigen ligase family protein n=1 Tax=Aquisalibacillus elongatus TaxID=485577 RepID=UPI0014744E5D|nr:O-antigen ligase family protein [Aquisalibacillus elongatus]
MIGVKSLFRTIDVPVFRSRAEQLALLFLLLAGVATYFSVEPVPSIVGQEYKFLGLFAWVSFISVFVFVYHFIPAENHLRLIQLIVVASIPVALYGIFQHFWINLLLEEPIESTFIKSWAFFDNSNHFGTYAMLMLMLLFVVYMLSQKRVSSVMWIVVGVVIFVALLYSGSRSGWLGLFAGALLITGHLVFRMKYLLKRWVVMMAVLFVTMLVVNFSEGNFILDRFISIGEEAQQIVEPDEEQEPPARWSFWTTSVGLMGENFWTGTGPSTFNTVYYDAIGVEDGLHDNSHNEFVEIGLTLGVPALVVYLMFIGLVLWRGVQYVRTAEGSEKILVVLLLAAVVAYLVKVMFNVSVIPVAPFFFVVLGVVWRRSVFGKE